MHVLDVISVSDKYYELKENPSTQGVLRLISKWLKRT